MRKINFGSIGGISEMALGIFSRIILSWPLSWRGLIALTMGIVLAKWTWILLAPHAIYSATTPEQSGSLDAGKIFGIAITTNTVSQGIALPNAQLLGVFAANAGKPGFAILQVDARQIGVAVGEEVATGTKLIEVHADHVILERAGVQQRVNLENKYANSFASSQLIKSQ